MAELTSLRDLYVDQLRDLHSAESQIIQALPELIDAASHGELRNTLEHHLGVTRKQKDRLDDIFERLGVDAAGHVCRGMEGILEEGSEMLERNGDAEVIDAGIIAAAQRVEHYEMAGYGTAGTYAERLGETEAARLLEETLEEEATADETLTRVAESTVNREAQLAG